jgi:hypothetical protein
MVNASGTMLTVPLLLPAGTAVEDLLVNIGGKNCTDVQLLQQIEQALNGSAATDGSVAGAVAVPGELLQGPAVGAGVYTLRCIAPDLWAGERH